MNGLSSFRHAVGSILCGLLIIVSLNGCGGSGGGDEGSAQGSLTFKLSIADSAAQQASASNSERELSELACGAGEWAIKIIEAEVIKNETTVGEARFICEDHQGTINNVPAGSNLKLDVFARDAEDTAIFIGSADKLTVTGGKTTDAGTIELRQIINRAPVLDPIGNKSLDENQLLTINLSARDPDVGQPDLLCTPNSRKRSDSGFACRGEFN